jgi:hypothetical protein
MDLTAEQFQMLGKLERDMDEGKQPFVMNRGQRWAMLPEAMKTFSLSTGQTVSDAMILGILQFNIEHTRKKMDDRDIEQVVSNLEESWA